MLILLCDPGAQREATHFKIRILDLVDTFLNKQPQSVFVPRVVLPLVKIIISSGPDERQLSEKTAGILRSRIGKLKDIPTSGFDESNVAEDLQSLHEIARKMAVPEVSACSIYLSRVLQGSEKVLDLYRASIDDFVARKNSKLAPAFLKDFVVRQIAYAWELREHIIGKCVPDVAVNVYRQMQLWGLVQTMLSQITPLVSGCFNDFREYMLMPGFQAQQPSLVDEFFAFVPLLRDALYNTLRSACQQTEHAPNATQAKELIKIGLQAVRLTRKLARPSDALDSCWDAAEFGEVKKDLASSDRFKSSPAIQTSAKQFASLLEPAAGSQNAQAAKKRKQVNGEVEGAVAVNGTHEVEPRKKRKKVKKQRQD
jgi:DNA polymerase phi